MKQIIDKVLEWACKYDIKINRSKCRINMNQVRYLGHILTGEGIAVDETKVKAIKKMKVPKNKKRIIDIF